MRLTLGIGTASYLSCVADATMHLGQPGRVIDVSLSSPVKVAHLTRINAEGRTEKLAHLLSCRFFNQRPAICQRAKASINKTVLIIPTPVSHLSAF